MSYPVIKYGEIIDQETRSLISRRYRTITQAINNEFWNIKSDTKNSLYVGSYGRGTAIDTSDLDILVKLPLDEYKRYDAMNGNGQSRLLQAIRDALLTPYSRSDVRADGQVVKITFSDNMKFEILPAFENKDQWGRLDGTYIYADSNMGGTWGLTNPKKEQEEMKRINQRSNNLLFDTCKHIRRIRNERFSSYYLSGIVIDSFVYKAIGNCNWSLHDDKINVPGNGNYTQVLLNTLNPGWSSRLTLEAPGSRQYVDATSSLECLKKVLNYMAN